MRDQAKFSSPIGGSISPFTTWGLFEKRVRQKALLEICVWLDPELLWPHAQWWTRAQEISKAVVTLRRLRDPVHHNALLSPALGAHLALRFCRKLPFCLIVILTSPTLCVKVYSKNIYCVIDNNKPHSPESLIPALFFCLSAYLNTGKQRASKSRAMPFTSTRIMQKPSIITPRP